MFPTDCSVSRFYLLNADQGHLSGHRWLQRQRRHGLDEHHASLLQRHGAGQRVEMLGGLGSSVTASWTGP